MSPEAQKVLLLMFRSFTHSRTPRLVRGANRCQTLSVVRRRRQVLASRQTAVQPAAIGARCPLMRIDDYGPVDKTVDGLSPAAKAGCLDLESRSCSASGQRAQAAMRRHLGSPRPASRAPASGPV